MTCDAITQTAPASVATAGQHHQATSGHLGPCVPVENTAHGQRLDGSLATTLQSIRRRLTRPEPGTVVSLRQRQRDVLHAILSREG